MPRRAAEIRGMQRPRHERPWPDVEAMAPRSRLRGRAPDRAAAAGCTAARGRWASTGSLPARAWTGGKGCRDRARGVVAVLRAMPAWPHATDEAFLFTTPTGRPVDDSSRSTGTARSARLASVRGRFYATRDLE